MIWFPSRFCEEKVLDVAGSLVCTIHKFLNLHDDAGINLLAASELDIRQLLQPRRKGQLELELDLVLLSEGEVTG